MFRMSEFRKQQVRLQIQRAIQKAPTKIKLQRDLVTLDKYKGKHRTTITVVEKEIFIDYKNSYILTTNRDMPDGNVNFVKRIQLYDVWREDFEYKIGDYFYLNGMKYTITLPVDNQELFWQCDIEISVPQNKLEVTVHDYS